MPKRTVVQAQTNEKLNRRSMGMDHICFCMGKSIFNFLCVTKWLSMDRFLLVGIVSLVLLILAILAAVVVTEIQWMIFKRKK